MISRSAIFNILLVWLLTSKGFVLSWGNPNTNPALSTSRTLIERPILNQSEVDFLISQVRIYVYEPPKTIVTALNLTKLVFQTYFRLETELLRLIRQKTGQVGIVVDDPATADFFWIPHTLRAHIPDEINEEETKGRYFRQALGPFLDYIVHDLPYYNQSGGTNHIFVYVWDNGPTCDPWPPLPYLWNQLRFWSVVRPMIFVGYFGMHGFTPVDPGGSIIRPDCFQIGHDITMPQYNLFHDETRLPTWKSSLHFLKHKASVARADFFFKGDTHLPGFYCSKHIRWWTGNYMKYCVRNSTSTNTSESSINDLTCKKTRSCSKLKIGLFWLCPAGWGCWSMRLYDAINRLWLPVILADGMVQPFERWFDYRAFTAKIITNGTVLGPDVRFPTFDQLHNDAISFRHACSSCNGKLNKTLCLQHPVSRKLLSLEAHRPWFTWDVDAPQNALKLFMLELHCRTPTGRATVLCQHSTPPTAHLEYGM